MLSNKKKRSKKYKLIFFIFAFNSSFLTPFLLGNCSKNEKDMSYVFDPKIGKKYFFTDLIKTNICGVSGNIKIGDQQWDRSKFNLPIFLSEKTHKIGDNFLRNCSSFNHKIVLPNSCYEIGNNFLHNCQSFNSNLILSPNINKINDNFMSMCTSFDGNGKIDFGNLKKLVLIGDNFMYKCENLNNNDITLASNKLIHIGKLFLSRCYKFDSNIFFGTPFLSEMGDGFLSYCYKFDRPIDLSKCGLKLLPSRFLYNCEKFNSELIHPNYLEEIGLAVMEGCREYDCDNFSAQKLPKSLKRVSGNFLSDCVKFNHDFVVPPNTKIDDGFMHNCYSMTSTVDIGINSFDDTIGHKGSLSCEIPQMKNLSILSAFSDVGEIMTIFKNITDEEKNYFADFKFIVDNNNKSNDITDKSSVLQWFLDGSVDQIVDNSDGVNFGKEADFTDLLVYSWKLKQILSYSLKTKNILNAINSEVITKEFEQWEKQNGKDDKNQIMDQIVQLNVVFALSQLYADTYINWDSFAEKFGEENWRNEQKNQPIVTKLMQLFNCQAHEISNHINALPQQIKQQIEQLLQNKQHVTGEIIELKNKLESNKNELIPFALLQLYDDTYTDWDSFMEKFKDENWRNDEKNQPIIGQLCDLLSCQLHEIYDKINGLDDETKNIIHNLLSVLQTITKKIKNLHGELTSFCDNYKYFLSGVKLKTLDNRSSYERNIEKTNNETWRYTDQQNPLLSESDHISRLSDQLFAYANLWYKDSTIESINRDDKKPWKPSSELSELKLVNWLYEFIIASVIKDDVLKDDKLKSFIIGKILSLNEVETELFSLYLNHFIPLSFLNMELCNKFANNFNEILNKEPKLKKTLKTNFNYSLLPTLKDKFVVFNNYLGLVLKLNQKDGKGKYFNLAYDDINKIKEIIDEKDRLIFNKLVKKSDSTFTDKQLLTHLSLGSLIDKTILIDELIDENFNFNYDQNNVIKKLNGEDGINLNSFEKNIFGQIQNQLLIDILYSFSDIDYDIKTCFEDFIKQLFEEKFIENWFEKIIKKDAKLGDFFDANKLFTFFKEKYWNEKVNKRDRDDYNHKKIWDMYKANTKKFVDLLYKNFNRNNIITVAKGIIKKNFISLLINRINTSSNHKINEFVKTEEFKQKFVNDLKNVFGSFNSNKLNYDLIENTNKLQDAKIKNFTNYNLAIFMFDTNLNWTNFIEQLNNQSWRKQNIEKLQQLSNALEVKQEDLIKTIKNLSDQTKKEIEDLIKLQKTSVDTYGNCKFLFEKNYLIKNINIDEYVNKLLNIIYDYKFTNEPSLLLYFHLVNVDYNLWITEKTKKKEIEDFFKNNVIKESWDKFYVKLKNDRIQFYGDEYDDNDKKLVLKDLYDNFIEELFLPQKNNSSEEISWFNVLFSLGQNDEKLKKFIDTFIVDKKNQKLQELKKYGDLYCSFKCEIILSFKKILADILNVLNIPFFADIANNIFLEDSFALKMSMLVLKIYDEKIIEIKNSKNFCDDIYNAASSDILSGEYKQFISKKINGISNCSKKIIEKIELHKNSNWFNFETIIKNTNDILNFFNSCKDDVFLSKIRGLDNNFFTILNDMKQDSGRLDEGIIRQVEWYKEKIKNITQEINELELDDDVSENEILRLECEKCNLIDKIKKLCGSILCDSSSIKMALGPININRDLLLFIGDYFNDLKNIFNFIFKYGDKLWDMRPILDFDYHTEYDIDGNVDIGYYVGKTSSDNDGILLKNLFDFIKDNFDDSIIEQIDAVLFDIENFNHNKDFSAYEKEDKYVNILANFAQLFNLFSKENIMREHNDISEKFPGIKTFIDVLEYIKKILEKNNKKYQEQLLKNGNIFDAYSIFKNLNHDFKQYLSLRKQESEEIKKLEDGCKGKILNVNKTSIDMFIDECKKNAKKNKSYIKKDLVTMFDEYVNLIDVSDGKDN